MYALHIEPHPWDTFMYSRAQPVSHALPVHQAQRQEQLPQNASSESAGPSSESPSTVRQAAGRAGPQGKSLPPSRGLRLVHTARAGMGA